MDTKESVVSTAEGRAFGKKEEQGHGLGGEN